MSFWPCSKICYLLLHSLQPARRGLILYRNCRCTHRICRAGMRGDWLRWQLMWAAERWLPWVIFTSEWWQLYSLWFASLYQLIRSGMFPRWLCMDICSQLWFRDRWHRKMPTTSAHPHSHCFRTNGSNQPVAVLKMRQGCHLAWIWLLPMLLLPKMPSRNHTDPDL